MVEVQIFLVGDVENSRAKMPHDVDKGGEKIRA